MSEDQLNRLFGDITVAQAILWVLAAAILLGLVIKFWPVITKFVATMNALADLPDKLTLLDEIHHEVRPNTGTSLNDAVRRVEERQVQQAETLDAHTKALEDQSAQLDGLQKLMEDGDAELSERVDDLEHTLNPKKET